MFVQTVLGWISPKEKAENAAEENKEKSVESLIDTSNAEETPPSSQCIILSPTIPDSGNTESDRWSISDSIRSGYSSYREMADIKNVVLQPSHRNGPYLGVGDVSVAKQTDQTKTVASAGGENIIERTTVHKLSPVRMKITQLPIGENGSSRRSIYTQTEKKKQRRRITLPRKSPVSGLERKNANPKDVATSTNNLMKVKEKIAMWNAKDVSTSTDNLLTTNDSECPNSKGIHSPKRIPFDIRNESPPKNSVLSPKKSKGMISIHSPGNSTKPSGGDTQISQNMQETNVVNDNTRSPFKTKETNCVKFSEIPSEPAKSAVLLPKNTNKEMADIPISGKPHELLKNDIHLQNETTESYEVSDSPKEPLKSALKKNRDIPIHRSENVKQILRNTLTAKLERSMPDEIEEEVIIPSRVSNLLREAAEQYSQEEMCFDKSMYGELLVLGTSHRYIMRKRRKANGVKEATYSSNNYSSPVKPVDSYQVSSASSRSVVVEYALDAASDMFQVGRHEHDPIDIRVTNSRGRKGVSRYACRIVIRRYDRYDARLYAAAFDASGNVFLGESGLSETDNVEDADGFTTNGVLLLQPGGDWREVSVRGRVYPLRTEAGRRRKRLHTESNVLQDGCLIDLCGVTLLWRTRDGIMGTPAEDCLVRMEDILKELAPDVRSSEIFENGRRETYVFQSCGHTVSMTSSSSSASSLCCPECGREGAATRLRVGKERGFYVEKGAPPSQAFRPCGHVSTRGTARFWSGVRLPHHGQERGICPFCATKLNPGQKYVGLVYPKH